MLQFLSFLILPLPSQCPIPPPKPTTKLRVLLGPVPTMSSASSSSSAFRPACNATVPSLGVDETGAVADEAFRGYTTPNLRRGGAGVAIVWFRNDLRVLDRAASDAILPVYCVDSWIFAGVRITSASPRLEIKRYEKQRVANYSTYWVLFELIWRDYFRFLSAKYGSSIFHLGGPTNVVSKWSQDQALFESWRDGRTEYPLIDANMKYLSATGFMSNRGRQIGCSFLVRDMGIDWRMGAEWFETCCWIITQLRIMVIGHMEQELARIHEKIDTSVPLNKPRHDPVGEYVAYWLPELRSLAKGRRNLPGPHTSSRSSH